MCDASTNAVSVFICSLGLLGSAQYAVERPKGRQVALLPDTGAEEGMLMGMQS